MIPPFVTRLSDEAAAVRLAALCASISRTDEAGADERAVWAPVLFGQALQLIAEVCGPELVGAAFEIAPDPQDRSIQLGALAERLWTVFQLFAACEEPGALLVGEAAQEVQSIAAGDKPRLFEPLKKAPGRRDNAYALAHLQIEVFKLEAIARASDLPSSEARTTIAAGFGVPWDTIRKWRNGVDVLLGTQSVRYHVAVSARLAKIYPMTMQDITQAAAVAGARYNRALGYLA